MPGMATEKQPTPTSPRRGLVIGLVATVILAGVAVTVLALILLGRGPATASDDANQTPTAQATASGSEPSPEPTASLSAEPTAEPTPPPLASDTIATVTVNELNLREEPRSGAKSLGHLSAGARVFVIKGPEWSDGFGWYQVARVDGPFAPSTCSDGCEGAPIGWVAGTSDQQDAWLEPKEVACPADPKLDAIGAMEPLERVACYGNQTLVLKGVVWTPCCGYVGPYIFEPAWLAYPSTSAYLGKGTLPLRFDPADSLAPPEYADIVRVTGHFDDAAAASCTIKVDQQMLDLNGEFVVDPPETMFPPINCRTQFVVESIEVLGNTGERCEC